MDNPSVQRRRHGGISVAVFSFPTGEGRFGEKR